MNLLFPICWLNGEFLSIWHGVPIDGHSYREYKTMKTKTKIVTILKCDLCGYEDKSWEWRLDLPSKRGRKETK
jgi:hypothetical protein